MRKNLIFREVEEKLDCTTCQEDNETLLIDFVKNLMKFESDIGLD